jgi:hypothetical protein
MKITHIGIGSEYSSNTELTTGAVRLYGPEGSMTLNLSKEQVQQLVAVAASMMPQIYADVQEVLERSKEELLTIEHIPPAPLRGEDDDIPF